MRFGYLDAHRLAPELARLASTLSAPDCVDSWDLADTYGLEMWLQVFWGAKGVFMTRKIDPRASAKRPYRAPALKVHGDFRKLTAAKGGGANDGGSSPRPRAPVRKGECGRHAIPCLRPRPGRPDSALLSTRRAPCAG